MEKKEQTCPPRKLKSFGITDKIFIYKKKIKKKKKKTTEVKLEMIKNEPSSFS